MLPEKVDIIVSEWMVGRWTGYACNDYTILSRITHYLNAH